MVSAVKATRSLTAGAIGGVIGWVAWMVFVAKYPLPPPFWGIGQGMEIWAGTLFGAILGACLGVAEGVNAGSQRHVQRAAAILIPLVAAGGLVGLFFGQQVYGGLGGHAGIPKSGYDFFWQFIVRSLGWGLWAAGMGTALGIGIGIVTGSTRRLMLSIAGGVLGGVAGGFLFQLAESLGQLLQPPIAAFIGLLAVATGIGLLSALAQELFKQAWVRVLVGRGEGREFQIAKATTVIGRDELADIPLFGDTQIARRHVLIQQLQGRHVATAAEPGLAFAVNGQMLSSSPLKDGDIIRISSREMQFHEKAGRQYSASALGQTSPAPSPSGPAVDVAPGACPFCGQPRDAYGNCGCTVGSPQLTTQPSAPQAATQVFGQSPDFASSGGLGFAIIAGPAAGRRITLAEGQSAGIGRAPDADIAVEADTFMSRRHAHLSVQGGVAVVQDDGSANGTFVNGSRVTQQAIRPGDIISLGQTQIRVEA